MATGTPGVVVAKRHSARNTARSPSHPILPTPPPADPGSTFATTPAPLPPFTCRAVLPPLILPGTLSAAHLLTDSQRLRAAAAAVIV